MKLQMSFCLALTCVSGLTAEPKPIQATVGQEFKIVLSSTGSTDYQWLLARPLDESLLKQAGRSFERRGGGCECLLFRAVAEGRTEIRLKYDRLWEKSVTPARTTNFVVVISRSEARK